jgi:hypothetical protein
MLRQLNVHQAHPTYVRARVRKGAPMPHAISPFIPERQFYQLRDECDPMVSRTEEDFQQAIQRFCAMYGWQGAIRGVQYRMSDASIILEQVITLGGLFGATGRSVDRELVFDIGLLQAYRDRTGVPATAIIQQIPVQMGQSQVVYAQQQPQVVYVQQQPQVVYAQQQPQVVYAQQQPQVVYADQNGVPLANQSQQPPTSMVIQGADAIPFGHNTASPATINTHASAPPIVYAKPV